MDMLDIKNKNPFALVPIAVLSDKRLTKNDLKVLCALLSFMTEHKKYCWPKRETISKRCGGLSISKISTATTRLVSFGWLIKEGNGGKSCSSRYTFTIPPIQSGIGANQVTVTSSETLTDTVSANVTISDRGKKETKEETIESEIDDDGFRKFWSVYPQKCNKPDAISEWTKLLPTPLLQQQIIANVTASAANNSQWLRDGGRFIPYPATYLKGRRWEDQLTHQQSYDRKSIQNQHHTSQIGDIYANNQSPRNRREHSVHIGSAIDAIIRNELGAEMDSTSF